MVAAAQPRLTSDAGVGMIIDADRANSTILVLTKSDLVSPVTMEDDIVKRVLGTSGGNS